MTIEQEEAVRREAHRIAVEGIKEMFRTKKAGTPKPASRKVLTRGCLELPDGSFRSPNRFTEEHTVQALQIVRRDIKRAIHGLGPLFGEHLLLEIAAEVIREDFNPDGFQTDMSDPDYPEIPNFD
jgi:hypothetical protein